MPPPRTERQWLAADLIERARSTTVKSRSWEPHVQSDGGQDDSPPSVCRSSMEALALSAVRHSLSPPIQRMPFVRELESDDRQKGTRVSNRRSSLTTPPSLRSSFPTAILRDEPESFVKRLASSPNIAATYDSAGVAHLQSREGACASWLVCNGSRGVPCTRTDATAWTNQRQAPTSHP